jgi:hypothetical protein
MMVLYSSLYDRFECVEMPNGFLIGRATVFSTMTGWGPDIAIRYPDGRLFLRGDLRMDFWDEDSFAGEFDDTPEGKTNKYIYVNGVGLIHQLELYQQYFDKKKPLHPDGSYNTGGNLMRAYLNLYYNDKSGRYKPREFNFHDDTNRRDWCPTAWFWP